MLWQKESSASNAMYIDLSPASKIKGKKKRIDYNVRRRVARTAVLKEKNNDLSYEYRQKGNQKYLEKNYTEAILLFNKSLCFAENGTELVGLAYANRSSCYFQMEMYKKCLADIELGKQNHYPENLMDKLKKRKTTCIEKMLTVDDQMEDRQPKLDFDPNEKFPCLANVVDIRKNRKYGRHIMATKDIRIGKVIIVEKSCVSELFDDKYMVCNNCCKENQNFIPCTKCASALFCTECMSTGFHAISCDYDSATVRSILMTTRIFDSANQLMKFVADMLRSKTLEMPAPLLDPKSKYRAFFQLCKPKPAKPIVHRIRSSYKQLIGYSEISKFFHSVAQRRFLMHLIGHHLHLIIANETYKGVKSLGDKRHKAVHVNIVAEYFNHSCYPNVALSCKDGILSGTVIRPIKKNEQLFITYIDGVYPYEGILKEQIVKLYNFRCKCEVCQLPWLPSNLELRHNPLFLAAFAELRFDKVRDGSYTRKQIEKMKNACFTFLVNFSQLPWCIEIGQIVMVLLELLLQNPTVKPFSQIALVPFPYIDFLNY